MSKVDLAVRRDAIFGHEHRAPASQLLHPVQYPPIEVELVADSAVVPVLSAPLGGSNSVYNREPPAVRTEVGGNKLALDVEP